MNIRTFALAGLLVLSPISIASAADTDTPRQQHGPGTMTGGGMMDGGMMGGGMMGGGMMGGGMMGGGMMGGGMMGRGGMMGGCGMMGGGMMGYGSGANYNSYVDGRIAFLKAELKITDAQSDAWNGYADALRANSQVMASMHKQMFDASQQNDRSAVKLMDLHVSAMKSRLAALETLKPATEALYKTLSKEQRGKADDLLPFMGCM